MGGLYEQRREEPRDDLLTALIQAEEGGDRLSHDELIVLFTNIFGGAIETTASVIASGIYELARHPEQAALLRRDPERFKKSAAEEVIRHRPGFYAAGKKAKHSHSAYGLDFKEGEPISILIGGPNRDPSRWDDPNRFDITRDARIWSLTFSMGEHFCLGQALARRSRRRWPRLLNIVMRSNSRKNRAGFLMSWSIDSKAFRFAIRPEAPTSALRLPLWRRPLALGRGS